MAAANFQINQDDQGRQHVRLVGQWSLRAQENDFAHLKESLNPFFADPFTQWDLQEVEQLDTAGLRSCGRGGWQDRRTYRTET